MRFLVQQSIRWTLWKETHGQDLTEYALMAAFVATAAATIVPSIATDVTQIFSKTTSVLARAQGS